MELIFKGKGSLQCLRVGCKRIIRFRGLCGTCYDHIRRQVTSGAATWQQLEDQGEVLPRNEEGRRRWADCTYARCP